MGPKVAEKYFLRSMVEYFYAIAQGASTQPSPAEHPILHALSSRIVIPTAATWLGYQLRVSGRVRCVKAWAHRANDWLVSRLQATPQWLNHA
ncbi:hypothetical protein D8674_009568 [Pyrus ussuriensis x Pyrus communis]|uniref:Uncharacterized protein n=1 Tax=Pyrus ussuriensis x Pyrus communis TaxID=2448454 RepID=A0A5N5F8L5_9ROSA|nr:hypothetical protein D8674_009568 [Pyrus ussuriensis x Pyrus communis]